MSKLEQYVQSVLSDTSTPSQLLYLDTVFPGIADLYVSRITARVSSSISGASVIPLSGMLLFNVNRNKQDSYLVDGVQPIYSFTSQSLGSPSYDSVVLPDKPLVYYRFNEDIASSGPVVDSSGNYRNATWNSTAGSQIAVTGLLTGDANKAARMNGSRFAAAAADPAFDSQSFTIECLIAPWLAGNAIASRWASTAADQIWYLQYQNDGSLRLGLMSSGGVITTVITPTNLFTVQPNGGPLTTQHLAVVVTPSLAIFYVNGQRVYSTAAVGTIRTLATTPLTVGGVSGSLSTNGVLDEFAFYTTALSADRIAVHYASAIVTPGISPTTNDVSMATMNQPIRPYLFERGRFPGIKLLPVRSYQWPAGTQFDYLLEYFYDVPTSDPGDPSANTNHVDPSRLY